MAARRLTSTLTFISQGETAAARRSAFPDDDALTEKSKTALATLRWTPPAGARALSAPGRAARATAEALGLAFEVDDALREIHHGRWAGLRLNELTQAEPEALAQWLADPDAAPHGGEPIGRFIERVSVWLDDRRACDGAAIVVASPTVVKAAVTAALKAPALSYWRIDVPPLTATELVGDGVRWNLKSLGLPLA